MSSRTDETDSNAQAAAYHRDMAETAVVANAIYDGHGALDFDHPLSEAAANELLGKPGDISIDPMVMQSLRIPTEIVVGARQLAKARGIKVSALFREWLADGFAAATASSTPVVEMRLVRDYLDELIRREQAA
jgi:hypothetical protein